ncbi:MAG: hypothetical protein GOMPHAMPRED_002096 [Gomphillus americanus]|uniref:GH64 domain-containing protein n=1 Tax=Gomphillus americanus TaxID=1940652 RepID=A0A8H3IJ24_9LECA|nr:MAG: hypothetical protein GOMPHAMPRED_002096 [Gomphillus americanus]
MRLLAMATAAMALLAQSLAAPTARSLQRRAQVVHPGDAHDIIITDKNTVNATQKANGTMVPNIAPDGVILPLSFTNNFAGSVNAYVTGLDANNKLVLLQPNGQFYYPPRPSGGVPQLITANVAIPIGGRGNNAQISIPGYISAARIWFAVGNLKFYTVLDGNGNPSLVEPSSANPNDPNAGVNWGFVELTWNAAGVFANISYVDFVGLILSMSLAASGQTQYAGGLNSNAVNLICAALSRQASQDGQPWGDLCMADGSGNNLRVIAPIDYMSTNPGAWNGYYDNYINQVWSTYTNTPLIIDTQAGAGKVSCQVSGGVLYCNGDNRGYNKPSVSDIWGCNSGPFGIQGSDNDVHRAVVPRLCAAFVRTTLLLKGGNVQPSLPSTSYYTTGPTMWYSAFVHQYETSGIGYAFSYDDVNPNGENQSGAVSSAVPQQLSITVG